MNIELLFESSNIKAYDSLYDHLSSLHLSSLSYSYQTSSHLTKHLIKNKKNLTTGAENWHGGGDDKLKICFACPNGNKKQGQ
jgi:hypothetical protein